MDWFTEQLVDLQEFLMRCKNDDDGRYVIVFWSLGILSLVGAAFTLPGSHLSLFAVLVVISALFFTNARISFWRMDAPQTAIQMTALAELKEEQHGTEHEVGTGSTDGDSTGDVEGRNSCSVPHD